MTRRPWHQATLATVRAYGDGLVGPGAVLDAIRRERSHEAIALQSDLANHHAHRLARTALALVQARDAAIFGDVAETMPAPANDTREIARRAGELGGVNVAASRLSPTAVRVDIAGLDAEQREALREKLVDEFGISISVEER